MIPLRDQAMIERIYCDVAGSLEELIDTAAEGNDPLTCIAAEIDQAPLPDEQKDALRLHAWAWAATRRPGARRKVVMLPLD